jgi:hypothetical protein
MATADGVIKPDFGSRSRHFIFNDDHERLRESIAPTPSSTAARAATIPATWCSPRR